MLQIVRSGLYMTRQLRVFLTASWCGFTFSISFISVLNAKSTLLPLVADVSMNMHENLAAKLLL